MTPQATETNVTNGVDIEALMATMDAITATPEIAKFKFRLQNQWQDGGHNRSRVNGFHGAGEETTRDKTFLLDAHEPPVLLGNDKGANPVEHLLHALTACATTAMVYNAAARGIEIEEVESSVKGSIDLRGFLGLDKNVRNGYNDIQMKLKIKADVSDEQIQELCQLGPTFSPVFDSLTNGVAVAVTGERM